MTNLATISRTKKQKNTCLAECGKPSWPWLSFFSVFHLFLSNNWTEAVNMLLIGFSVCNSFGKTSAQIKFIMYCLWCVSFPFYVVFHQIITLHTWLSDLLYMCVACVYLFVCVKECPTKNFIFFLQSDNLAFLTLRLFRVASVFNKKWVIKRDCWRHTF